MKIIKIKNIDLEVESVSTANGDIVFMPFHYKGYDFPKFIELRTQMETYLNIIDENRIVDFDVRPRFFSITTKTDQKTFKVFGDLFNVYIYINHNFNPPLLLKQAIYAHNSYQDCLESKENHSRNTRR